MCILRAPAQPAATPGTLDASFKPTLGNPAQAVVVQADGRVLVSTGKQVVRLQADGALDPAFPTVTVSGPRTVDSHGTLDYASLSQLALQTNGGVILGGLFTTANQQVHHDLARLHPDGTLDDSFAPDPGTPVAGIAMPAPAPSLEWLRVLSSGKILVTGFFVQFNGQPTPQLAVLGADGNVDTSFAYDPATLNMTPSLGNRPVPLAELPDGRLFLAGSAFGGLSEYGSLSSNVVVRFHADGTVDSSFSPVSLVFASSLNGARFVRAGVIQADGKLLLGGNFVEVNGTRTLNFARVNADGSPDTAFNNQVSVNGPVNALALQPDGRILLAGDFSQINGQSRQFVARLNNDGTLDTSFDPAPGPSGAVSQIVLQPGYGLLISGAFDSVSGQSRPGLARLFLGNLPDGLPRITSNPTNQTAVAGESVSFAATAVSPTPLQYQWLLNGAPKDGATNAGLLLHVVHTYDAGDYSLQVSNSAGTVTSATAHLDVTPLPPSGSGGVDIDFSGPNLAIQDPNGLTGPIDSLLVQPDGKVLAAGAITSMNGQPAQGIVRLESDGTIDPSFSLVQDPNQSPFDNPEVGAALLQPDGRIVIARNRIPEKTTVLRLNTDGSPDPGFSAQFSNSNATVMVQAMVLQPDGRVLCGGMFTAVNSVVHTNIVRLNADGTVDPTFLGPPWVAWERISCLGLQADGSILSGVGMRQPGTEAAPALLRLNADGTIDPRFSPHLSHLQNFEEPYFIAVQRDGQILVGGRFTHVSGQRRDGIVRLSANGAVDPGFVPPTPDAFNWNYLGARAMATQSDGKLLLVVQRDDLSGVTPQHIVRLNPDGSLDPTFTAALLQNRTSFYPWTVSALALTPEGSLLIGGRFSDVGAAARPVLARLFTIDPSVLKLYLPAWTGGGLRFCVPTVHGVGYSVETSADLRENWHSVSTFQGQGTIQTIIIPSGPGESLYRLRASP